MCPIYIIWCYFCCLVYASKDAPTSRCLSYRSSARSRTPHCSYGITILFYSRIRLIIITSHVKSDVSGFNLDCPDTDELLCGMKGREAKFTRKSSSSSDSTSSDEEPREPSTERKQLLERLASSYRRLQKENKAKAEALRKKVTSGKVAKSGLGAAIEAEDPEIQGSKEHESDEESESEPDVDTVDVVSISERLKEDDSDNLRVSNKPVAFVKPPPLL